MAKAKNVTKWLNAFDRTAALARLKELTDEMTLIKRALSIFDGVKTTNGEAPTEASSEKDEEIDEEAEEAEDGTVRMVSNFLRAKGPKTKDELKAALNVDGRVLRGVLGHAALFDEMRDGRWRAL